MLKVSEGNYINGIRKKKNGKYFLHRHMYTLQSYQVIALESLAET